ncbi:hypothetical protein [Saccharibacillus alkalitolerans]|uniref:Carboxypeptidase regulatory-like domain-containing protein n=1 Tax=Saccharibacillus alkalitolerans TaxID=2705290 RepID=A0ABX0F1E0_9BACL|nr:hypothetical protein [Saccharibacillus alkalitolerans]NGZ74357.1 hypothetical protein [Saccharibacillus alkalitolerans]
MMKISRKTARRALYALLTLLVLAAAAIWIPRAVENHRAAQSPEALRARFIQEIGEAKGQDKLDLIARLAVQSPEYDPYAFDLRIGPRGSMHTSGSDETGLLKPEDRLPMLEQYVGGGRRDETLVRAAEQLAYEYDALGRSGDGDRALEEALARFEKGSLEYATLMLDRAERELAHGSLETAGKLLEESDVRVQRNAVDLKRRAAWIDSFSLFARGRTQEAIAEADRGLSGSPSAQPLRSLRESLTMLAEEPSASSAVFKGRLTYSDGKPAARAGVFLLGENEDGSPNQAEPYRAVTDPEGRFEIRNVVPGYYGLELGLDEKQADGWSWPIRWDDWIRFENGETLSRELVIKPRIELRSPVNEQKLTGETVEFSWSAVEDAAYYDLIGSIPDRDDTISTGTLIRERIAGNRIVLPIEDLYAVPGSIDYPESGDWKASDPYRMLAYMNPDARFSWSVRAYDADGRVISESTGYGKNADQADLLPFFYLKQRTLTDTDKLLLKGKLSEAAAAYRQETESDPNDVHALRMLSRLSLARAEISGDAQAKKETALLLRRLAEFGLSPQEAQRLSELSYAEAAWEDYDDDFRLYKELNGGYAEPSARARHASSLLYRGQTDEARRAFEAIVREDPLHRFLGLYLAAELRAGLSLREASALAERYPELGDQRGSSYWAALLDRMSSERSRDLEAFDTKLQLALDEFLRSRKIDPNASPSEAGSGFASIDAFVRAVADIR